MQKIVWRLGQIIMGYFWGIAFKIDAKMKVSFNDIIGYESQKSDLPINRSHLYRILNKAVSECNIDIHIGNETLRKTFGYHYYYKTRDVKYLKEIFNQASQKTLFEYLGIDNDLVECKEFFL